MVKFKWLVVLVLFLIAVPPCFADDRAPIVGIWRLVSLEREYQATGEREYPMGKTPTGYILLLPEGRMAVVITGEGRKAPTTDQDRAGLFNSLVAYTGRYRVDGDKWITTVDVSANPAWVGTEQTRSFRVTGDQLQEMTAWAARPDNRMARAILTYERANIKAMLLRPSGWSGYWKGCIGIPSGESELMFEAREEKVVVMPSVRSGRGGHGRALTELGLYQDLVRKGVAGTTDPDLLIAGIDGNCSTFAMKSATRRSR